MDLENFPTRETARDMMSMISPIYEKSYVGKWIFEVMSEPLALAQQTVKDLEKEAFPETATWSLPYWEQAYGIDTNENLSQEERRWKIVKKRNFRNPMNPYRIAQLVSDVCGRTAELIENVAPHTFEIRIGPGESEAELQAIIDEVNKDKQSQKSFRVVFETPVGIRIRAEPLAKVFNYRMTGENKKAGRYPQPNIVGVVTPAQVSIAAREQSQVFPYVMAGTVPDVNTIGKIEPMQVNAAVDEQSQVFPYVAAGTTPEPNTIGEISTPGVNAGISGTATSILYKACGTKRTL
jgi:hypothetical protein